MFDFKQEIVCGRLTESGTVVLVHGVHMWRITTSYTWKSSRQGLPQASRQVFGIRKIIIVRRCPLELKARFARFALQSWFSGMPKKIKTQGQGGYARVREKCESLRSLDVVCSWRLFTNTINETVEYFFPEKYAEIVLRRRGKGTRKA